MKNFITLDSGEVVDLDDAIQKGDYVFIVIDVNGNDNGYNTLLYVESDNESRLKRFKEIFGKH
jgi:hypothetical protein